MTDKCLQDIDFSVAEQSMHGKLLSVDKIQACGIDMVDTPLFHVLEVSENASELVVPVGDASPLNFLFSASSMTSESIGSMMFNSSCEEYTNAIEPGSFTILFNKIF